MLKSEIIFEIVLEYTANIYSQFAVLGCVTFLTVIWQWLLQPMAVHVTLTDIEEYSLQLDAVSDSAVFNKLQLEM